MARFALLTILVCCGIHCGDVLEASLCQEETDATDSTTAIFMYKLFHSLFHLIDEHKKKEETMTAPVVFYASLTPSLRASATPFRVSFDHVFTNAGGGYNVTNGVFTAPVAGFYSITATMTSNQNSRLFLMLNGNGVQYVVSDGTWESDTRTANLELEAGDKIWVEAIGAMYGESTCGYSSSIGPAYKCYHSTFSGFLLSRK